jgi:hypothetical protein
MINCRLVSQGFSSNNSARSSVNSDCSYSQGISPRIPVSSPLLLELLHTVYYGAEKGATGAVQALHDITQRANYETYAGCLIIINQLYIRINVDFLDVLLAANAIKNLIQHSSSISVTPRPSQTHSISKSMITNASFRTKKLPGR